MIILNSIEGIFSIIIIISIGYFLTSKKLFDKDTANLFSELVFNVALPSLIMSSLLSNIDNNGVTGFSNGFIVSLASTTLSYIIGIIVLKIIKVEPGRQGIFKCMFYSPNTIFMGLPINLSLFGDKCIPYVFLYYIVNTLFFWTIGIRDIKSDNLNTLKQIFSPPLLSFIFTLVLVSLNISVPKFLIDTFKYLGDITTPLSMLFIGINMYYVNLKDIKFIKDIIAISIGRFIISPLTIVLFSYLIPLPKLMKDVFIIQSSMPVMTLIAIIVDKYNLDSNYASVITVITTIMSVISIPIYSVILNR